MEKIFKTPEELLPALADFIVDKATHAILLQKKFSLVLSGGSSPKKLYELLTSDSYKTSVDWSKVYFFFGDERDVPQDHKDSNYLMAKNALFGPLNIQDDHIFAIDTTKPAEEAALAYQETILKYFDGDESKFDLILLGLGDNSHTASLFPHTEVLKETTLLVSGLYIEEVKMKRITMTAPLINLAHTIAFLVYGAGKAEAVYHILKSRTNIDEYPAQLIHPIEGELIWFLDEPAAAKID